MKFKKTAPTPKASGLFSFVFTHYVFTFPGIINAMSDPIQTTNTQQQDTTTNNDGIFGAPFTFPGEETKVNEIPKVQTSDLVEPKPEISQMETLTKQEMTPPVQPVDADKNTMVSGGVTFMDDAMLQPAEKNIFNSDSSFKQKEMESVKNIIQSNIPPQQDMVEPTNPPVETKDLEEVFTKTFNTPLQTLSSKENDPILLEEEKLRHLHKELKDKASSKKIVVKERLEKLKIEKESLGKELEDIKELEAIAGKIEEKLKSLETIDTEIDSLEKQAIQELQ